MTVPAWLNDAVLYQVYPQSFANSHGVPGDDGRLPDSLVKDHPGRRETAGRWGEMRGWLDQTYPDAVLLSAWGDPAVAVPDLAPLRRRL